MGWCCGPEAPSVGVPDLLCSVPWEQGLFIQELSKSMMRIMSALLPVCVCWVSVVGSACGSAAAAAVLVLGLELQAGSTADVGGAAG